MDAGWSGTRLPNKNPGRILSGRGGPGVYEMNMVERAPAVKKFAYTDGLLDELEVSLSRERLGTYPDAAEGGERDAKIGDPEGEDWQTLARCVRHTGIQMNEIFLGLISAASGLLGVVVGAVLPLLRDAGNNRRQARYLAIRIACLLDEFLDECTNVVGDDGLCSGQRNADDCLEAQVSQPKGLPLPDDVDWRSIDHGLMYKILALPSRIERDNRSIAVVAEHSFPPDYREYFEERQYRYACLGLDVASLIQTLQSTYGIPEQEPGEWDPVAYLVKEKVRIEKCREDRDMQSSIL